MSVTFNPETKAYERDGFEPVSKDYITERVWWYIRRDIPRERELAFVEKVFRGECVDEAEFRQFMIDRMILDTELMVGLVFVISEHHQDIAKTLTKALSLNVYRVAHSPGRSRISFDVANRTLLWYFMLCEEDDVIVFAIGSIVENFRYLSVCFPGWNDNAFAQSRDRWFAILFHFANVVDPQNIQKLKDEMKTVMRAAPLSIHIKEAGIIIRNELYKYLFKFSLFERLWLLVKSE